DSQARFRIGYAPADRYALRDHLAAKSVSVEAMVEAGLLVTGDEIQVPYDRFRDRVMFPIADPRGRIVAFGGRALAADVPAKYLNSPDTPLFSKGRLLYNFHHARKAAHEHGTVIAVEGYVDVIAMTAIGYGNAVAPLGTALTEEQLALLWRLADEPILCFDGDKAGRRAAYRALDVALPSLVPGKSLRFALLPEGQDPDDLARAGGQAALARVLDAARPLADMLWSRELEAGPLDTPERRAALERRLKEALQVIRDETLKRYYRQDIEARLAALSSGSRAGRFLRQNGSGGRFRPQQDPRRGYLGRPLPMASRIMASSVVVASDQVSPREAMMLAVLAAHPELLQAHAETLSDLDFGGRPAERLRSALLDCAASGGRLDSAVIEARLSRAGLDEAVERLTALVRPGDRWALDPHADPLRLEDALRQAFILQRRARTLHSELRAAERALAEGESEANLAWMRQVQNELFSIEGAEAETDGISGRMAG
ncbi:MAG TPA: toprim domain-containing protein, partial [Beijerinckiaceae bacterium]|nr:toprim domain-containing protein [Beijerinckiaceae bacterium]